MAGGRMNGLLERLSRSALLQDGAGLSDGQLLARFLGRRDDGAFAALLRRHGPMVLGVCRRLLGSPDDAEDAFQATFLIFVRKARSIAARESVGGWLYRVAYRTALEARAKITRRRARERQVEDVPHKGPEPADDWRELLPLLDRELNRLPEKYRLAVVLCDLEGRTRREAARQLRIPEGTLSSRLATARKALARRLGRHGAALPAAGLAALLGAGTASAGVPASLFQSTTRAATAVAAGQAAAAGAIPAKVAALTEGVIKAMFLAKLKTVSAVLCGVAVLGLGTGGLMYQARGQTGAPAAAAQAGQGGRPRSTEKARERDVQTDRERALREELEAARRDLAKLRAQIEDQQVQAMRARLQAEQALLQAAEQRDRAAAAEQEARRKAQQAIYVNEMQQAQQQFRASDLDRRKKRPEPPRDPSVDLDKKRADLLQWFAERRRQLQEEQRQLEAKERATLADLDQQRERLGVNQKALPPQPPVPARADKLDRILERLDRLERLLDRLAPGRPAPGSGPNDPFRRPS